jgi:hypothetical protein
MGLLMHKFPPTAFSYFSAGHQRPLSLQVEDHFPPGKTNLPLPPMQKLEKDNLNMMSEEGRVVLSIPPLLKNYSYLKYKRYSDLFQPQNYQPLIGVGGQVCQSGK